jgi:hypothetical protein
MSETLQNETLLELKNYSELWGVRAFWEDYDGALVSGHTNHYVITPDSKPIFHLNVDENFDLGTIKSITPLWRREITLSKDSNPYREAGITYYICNEPFSVWIRHRGYTGDNSDDYDEIIPAVKIENLEEFLRSKESMHSPKNW